MLVFEIFANGGVRIEGTTRDLRELSSWVMFAALNGDASATYVTDEAVTQLEIVRVR